MSENAEQAAALMRQRGAVDPVDVAILLGFGMSGFTEPLIGGASVDYAELPGFPNVCEQGHAGKLSVGSFEGVNLALLQGQAHFFGAGDPACMKDALTTIKILGARHLLIFAGASSVKADLYPGNLMLVNDHIALFGLNPLIGEDESAAGASMHEAYDPRLHRRMRRAAAAAGVTLQEGVLMWMTGPTNATPAEARLARQLGADALCFGVAPEIILARRLGLRTGAVVAATHFSAAMQASDQNAAETQRHSLAATVPLRRLLRAFLKTADTF